MLNLENSFCVQHWQYFLLLIVVGYIIQRMKDSRTVSSSVVQVTNDDRTIAQDVADDEGADSDDGYITLSQNVELIPYQGARVTLEGGAEEFYDMMNDRRSVRTFSSKPVDIEIVKRCIHAAGTSPSRVNNDPWTYVLVER